MKITSIYAEFDAIRKVGERIEELDNQLAKLSAVDDHKEWIILITLKTQRECEYVKMVQRVASELCYSVKIRASAPHAEWAKVARLLALRYNAVTVMLSCTSAEERKYLATNIDATNFCVIV